MGINQTRNVLNTYAGSLENPPLTLNEIPEWMNELSMEVAELERLTDKLSPIIRLSNDMNAQTPAPECVLCPLANQLRELKKRIHAINDILSSAQI